MNFNSFAQAVGRLSTVCGVLAALLLIAGCIVVCEMVFVRSVLGVSTIWQTEFVQYAIVGATLLGSPYVLARGGHVRVHIVAQRARGQAGRGLELLSSAAGIAFCAVLAWSGWRYFHEAWAAGWVTESVWAPPLWIVLLPLPVGIGVLTLQYVVDAVSVLAGAERPSSSTEPSARDDAQ